MQRMIREFRDFFVSGNVIDLAVAVIMGGLFLRIVQALVDYVLMPIIGIIFGEPSFDEALILTINDSEIRIGAFLTVVVAVVLTALAVFLFIVKPYNFYRSRRRTPTEKEAVITEVQLLAEIRDLLRQR
jgi:large conductance mechanosensitive channel